jgi:hypothetical protein
VVAAEDLPEVELFRNEKIPVFWRYAMPAMLLITTGLFLTANIIPGTTMEGHLKLFGLETPTKVFKAFTIA